MGAGPPCRAARDKHTREPAPAQPRRHGRTRNRCKHTPPPACREHAPHTGRTARTTTHTPNTTACRGVAIPLSATHPHGGFLTEDERQYVKGDAVATIRSCNRTIVTTTTEQPSDHMKRGMRHYASSGPTTLNGHHRKPASAVIRPSQTTILRKYSDFMQGYNSIAQENIHVA